MHVIYPRAIIQAEIHRMGTPFQVCEQDMLLAPFDFHPNPKGGPSSSKHSSISFSTMVISWCRSISLCACLRANFLLHLNLLDSPTHPPTPTPSLSRSFISLFYFFSRCRISFISFIPPSIPSARSDSRSFPILCMTAGTSYQSSQPAFLLCEWQDKSESCKCLRSFTPSKTTKECTRSSSRDSKDRTAFRALG